MKGRLNSPSVFILVLLLVAGWGLSGCRPLLEPEVKGMSGFAVNRKNEEKKIQYEFDLEVFNPNRKKIALLKYELDVYVNGKKVGTSLSTQKHKLSKFEKQSFHFVVLSDLKQTLGGIMGLLTSFLGGDQEVNVKLDGVVKARAGWVSRKMPVEIEYPVKIQL